MIDKAYIERLSGRLSEVETEMSDPAVATDHRRYRKLLEEHVRLKRIVERGQALFKLRADAEENRAIAEDPSADSDFRKLAADESAAIAGRLVQAERDALVALLPPDSEDSRNAIFEIRAGTGGEEAALFAGELFRMYSHFVESKGWKVGMMDASPSSMGGYKEVIFFVEGRDVYGTLKYESGGHRVQRVPETEAQGRVHTSAATVAVLPEVEEDDEIVIPTEDLRIDIFCSSGPGGQSVNTTYSAVRITHLPTGISVQSQDERSQRQNKEKAMKVIMARIRDVKKREESARMANEKRSLTGNGDRSERIRTYNFPQNRLTDHRINLTLYNLNQIIEGDLAEIIGSLREHDIKFKLERLMSEEGRDRK